MYLPEGFAMPEHPSNCFELLGFDVLIDENLKPWLLEVNLSPSMNTETSLDIELKTKLLVDLFNLIRLPKPTQLDQHQHSKPLLKRLTPTHQGLFKRNFLSKQV